MKKKNNICVYRHRRLDTNKIFYIGIGLKNRPYDINNRNQHWNNIVNKTKYEVDILYENLTWEDACELECLLIKEYGRKDLRQGFLCNQTDGGEGSYGRIVSDNTKNKISLANKGRASSFKGVKHTLKTRKLISAKRKGIATNIKKIIKVDENIIFNSCTECAEYLNIVVSTLSYHLKKENNRYNVKYFE